MRHIYSALIAFLFVAAILSCAALLFPSLEVVSISTDNNIVIAFSAPPSEESIKIAFSMTEDGKTVYGTFTFNDRTVIFEPINSLRANHEYHIIITATAEDKNGNSLLKDFEYRFFTKPDTEPPRILEISPVDESNLTVPPGKISIVFSKTIDTVSFEKALSITPTITYVLEWNSEHSAVDIIPVKPLAEGVRYTTVISTALTDDSRNTLLVPFTSTFLYGLDLNPPGISVRWHAPNGDSGFLIPDTLNIGLPSDCYFIIEFDKQVFIDSIAGFIEITPSASITVTSDFIAKNNARLALNQKPEWGKNYTLKLKKGITDTFGNKTETNVLYPLVFNNEKHRPVTFSGGILNNNSIHIFINTSTDYSPITMDVTYFDPSGHIEKSTELYYAFRISAEADSVSLVSAMQAISISTRNSCAYVSIRTMKLLTPADIEFTAIYGLLDNYGDGSLCILKIGIDIENTENRGFIIFTIRKDIADTLGNTMVDSLNFTLNKQ